MSDPNSSQALQRTPLHALHVALGAKMVPFAGYEMPVSYPAGILAEHRQCREAAVLFDVSHMGQLRLVGADAAAALETLVPVDIVGLPEGKQRYALFTNAAGGILDDLMVTRGPITSSSSSMPAARPRTSPICAPRSRAAAASSRCRATPCSRCKVRRSPA